MSPDQKEEKRDTVWYERRWKDPEKYVMGRPSDKQIAAWKKACEEANPDGNRFEVEQYMEPVEAYVAFTDLIWVMNQTDSKYSDDFEFFCWRLNEMAPIAECPEGEGAHFYALEAQYEYLCRYDPGAMYEINSKAALDEDYTRMLAEYYHKKLMQRIPSVKELLQQERKAFLRYKETACKAFDMIVLGDEHFWGTITPSASASFSSNVSDEYSYGTIPVYLSIADPENPPALVRHISITDEMISNAYDIFLASIVVDSSYEMENMKVPEEYTAENLRRVLKEDQTLWNGWMRCRRAVSAALPKEVKAVYDEWTNNVRRMHLISLLNRYTECDFHEFSYSKMLLPRDCSDEMLMQYDYKKAYKEYCGIELDI